MENNHYLLSSQSSGERLARFFRLILPRSWRDWKRIVLLAVIVLALTYLIWGIVSKGTGEVAGMSFSPSATTVTAGQDFNLNINLDTHNNNVVVAKAMVKFDTASFELRSVNTASSVFAASNTCQYNGKACEIITSDTAPATGTLIITENKPRPGVNTAAGLVATITFRAKKAITPSTQNITLYYTALNSYDDSDVILDDGNGTDILTSLYITNATVTAILPVPVGVGATAAAATQNNLTWTNSIGTVGITGYKIYGGTSSTNLPLLTTVATNSYQHKNLAPLTTYYYKITATNGTNESAQSTQVSAKTLADTTKPNPPTLTAGTITMSEVNLSWTAATDEWV